jgi:hypothetical protein
MALMARMNTISTVEIEEMEGYRGVGEEVFGESTTYNLT